MNRNQRSSWPVGALLIVAGLGLLIATQSGIGGSVIPALLGLFFLGAHAIRRRYGFLVAGSILTGLGVGVLLEQPLGGHGAAMMLGLGLGFVGIFAVDSLRGLQRAHWWPLLPGTVLLLAGLDVATGEVANLEWLVGWWPVVLVAIGVLLMVRSAPRPRPPA